METVESRVEDPGQEVGGPAYAENEVTNLRLEEDLARLREEPVTGRQFQELHLAHFDPNTRQPLLYFDHLDPGPGGLGVADKGGRPLSMFVLMRLQSYLLCQ